MQFSNLQHENVSNLVNGFIGHLDFVSQFDKSIGYAVFLPIRIDRFIAHQVKSHQFERARPSLVIDHCKPMEGGVRSF